MLKGVPNGQLRRLQSQFNRGVTFKPIELLRSVYQISKLLRIKIVWQGTLISEMNPSQVRKVLTGLETSFSQLQGMVQTLLIQTNEIQMPENEFLIIPLQDLVAFSRKYGKNLEMHISSMMAFYKICKTMNDRNIFLRANARDVYKAFGERTLAVEAFREMEIIASRIGLSLTEAQEYFDLWVSETRALRDRRDFEFGEILKEITS